MTDVTQRSERAKALMDDPLVVEAFETMEREFKELFANSAEPDSEGRERIHRMLWSMRRFKLFFQSVMEDGQIHEHQLQALKRGQF